MTAFAGVLLAACAPSPERTVTTKYVAESDEYVNVSSGVPSGLKAGKHQDIEISFTGPMEEVYASMNGKIIKMKPDSSRIKWSAKSIKIPTYADLGAEKFIRVYGKNLGGESLVGTDKDKMPGSWLRRGEDGKFPDVPGDNFIRIPIIDWK